MSIHDRDWYRDEMRKRQGLPPQQKPGATRPGQARAKPRASTADPWAKPSPNRARWARSAAEGQATRHALVMGALAASFAVFTLGAWAISDMTARRIPTTWAGFKWWLSLLTG